MTAPAPAKTPPPMTKVQELTYSSQRSINHAIGELRKANAAGTPVESLILLELIRCAVELETRIDSLRGAIEAAKPTP